MSLENEIVIVSGLPRSGTSLMMQMLVQGGLPPLTDAIREADTDNPRGYYEFERVKRTKDDASWLSDARGKVVKMISLLLYDLPDTESYRIIFMRRKMSEVIASQEKMLIRRGQKIPRHETITSAFNTHLEKVFAWLQSQNHMSLHEVSYNELIEAAGVQVGRISEFLDHPLDTRAMMSAIAPQLYRNRERTCENHE